MSSKDVGKRRCLTCSHLLVPVTVEKNAMSHYRCRAQEPISEHMTAFVEEGFANLILPKGMGHVGVFARMR